MLSNKIIIIKRFICIGIILIQKKIENLIPSLKIKKKLQFELEIEKNITFKLNVLFKK